MFQKLITLYVNDPLKLIDNSSWLGVAKVANARNII